MSVELVNVDEWVYTVLAGDATVAAACGTRIWADAMPDRTGLPAVVFQHQATVPDTTTFDGNRILTQTLMLARCIDQATSWTGTVRAVADAIDSALHQAAGSTVDGVQVATCIREQPWRLLDVVDGRQYRHMGGLYRITSYEP